MEAEEGGAIRTLQQEDQQKAFMAKLGRQLCSIIETKIKIIGYNANEESLMLHILNSIYLNKSFTKFYKNMATNVNTLIVYSNIYNLLMLIKWMAELDKPSRRFKAQIEQLFSDDKASSIPLT